MDHRERAAKGKGCIQVSSFPILFDRNASLLCLSFVFLGFLLPFPPYFPLPPLSLTCPIPFSLFSFLFFSYLYLLTSPPHEPRLAHLPAPTSCAILWCALVLAKARPGRTDGYLVRQRSPWAPTPFPSPWAAQVSRWKVRGAGRGRMAWA